MDSTFSFDNYTLEEILQHEKEMEAESLRESEELDREIEEHHLDQLFAMAEADRLRREEEEDREEKHPRARCIMEMALRDKGGRGYTRGWRGAALVKRRTSKAMRRLAKQDPENAPTKLVLAGWVW